MSIDKQFRKIKEKEMDAELKDKWVKALRGQGEKQYKQITGALRIEGDQYCCLGVLCDVYDPDMWSPDEYRYVYSGFASMLPPGIGELIETEASKEADNDNQTLLMYMNDRDKKSFNQIADWVETNL